MGRARCWRCMKPNGRLAPQAGKTSRVLGGDPPPHQPSPGGSASATPPQGGSGWAVLELGEGLPVNPLDSRFRGNDRHASSHGDACNKVVVRGPEKMSRVSEALLAFLRDHHSPLEGESVRLRTKSAGEPVGGGQVRK